MKWRIPIAVSVIAILVSAQASLQFRKPGVTEEEFEHDKKSCLTHAISHRQEQPAQGDTTDRAPVLLEGIELTPAEHRLALICMLEKGYRFVTSVEK